MPICSGYLEAIEHTFYDTLELFPSEGFDHSRALFERDSYTAGLSQTNWEGRIKRVSKYGDWIGCHLYTGQRFLIRAMRAKFERNSQRHDRGSFLDVAEFEFYIRSKLYVRRTVRDVLVEGVCFPPPGPFAHSSPGLPIDDGDWFMARVKPNRPIRMDSSGRGLRMRFSLEGTLFRPTQ